MDKWELKTRYTREIHTKKFKCAKKGTVIRTIHSTYIQGVSKLMGGPFPIKQLPMILLSIKSKCYNSNNTRPNQEVGIPSLVGGSWPGREKPHLTKTRGWNPLTTPFRRLWSWHDQKSLIRCMCRFLRKRGPLQLTLLAVTGCFPAVCNVGDRTVGFFPPWSRTSYQGRYSHLLVRSGIVTIVTFRFNW